MGRKSKAKFELKGHTLPGINQKSETSNLKDGKSPSSAFQMQSPIKETTIGLEGIKINPMASYNYKSAKIPSFRDMVSLEQQQAYAKKVDERRAARKEEKAIAKETEKQKRIDEFVKTLPELETLDYPEYEDPLEKWGSELAPLTILEIEEKEKESYTREDLKNLPEGSAERKKAYDDLGWAYDKTIGPEYAKTKKKIITKKEETKTPTESKKYTYDFGGGDNKKEEDNTSNKYGTYIY